MLDLTYCALHPKIAPHYDPYKFVDSADSFDSANGYFYSRRDE